MNIVWSANDNMALGVVKAIEELDIKGVLVVGGVDWDKAAREAVEQGTLHVSVGGHFLDGAWAAVLLYDYLNGVDFANEKTQFESPMVGMNHYNVQTLSPFLSLDRQSLDFSQFSKSKNPLLKLYALDLHAIAAGLDQRRVSAELTDSTSIGSPLGSPASSRTTVIVACRSGTRVPPAR